MKGKQEKGERRGRKEGKPRWQKCRKYRRKKRGDVSEKKRTGKGEEGQPLESEGAGENSWMRRRPGCGLGA